MYVDKTLSGIKAVQTLSRLNRAHPKKHDVFVLDFLNDADTIRDAFTDYYRATILAGETDPDKLHDLQADLDVAQVYSPEQSRAAKNSRNRATATGPASTIIRGNASRSPDGVLRPAEAHLDPPGLDRHAVGQAGQARRARLAGHRDPDPGEPRLAERGHQARAPLLLAAERGPLPVLPQLPQERGPPKDTRRPDARRPERPHPLRRPRPRDPEQPLHVAPREQVPVQGLELADGVGDGKEPPGRGRHQAGLV